MANLHLVTGYNGSAHITAADHGSLNAALFGAGKYVLNRGNKFAATVISNNCVRIASGDLLFNGRHVRMGDADYVDLTISNGTSGYNRNDLIACRYTRNTSTGVEQCSLVVLVGTPTTGTASDPTYMDKNILNGVATADFPLYRIPISGLTVGTPVQLFSVANSYQDDTGGFQAKFKAESHSGDKTITEDDNGKVIGVSGDFCSVDFPVLPSGTEVTIANFGATNLRLTPTGSALFAVPGNSGLEGASDGLACYIEQLYGSVTMKQLPQGIWLIQGNVDIRHEGG